MTGYTVHTGSNLKFASNWDQIFSGKSAGKKGKPASIEEHGEKESVKPSTKKASVKKTKR